MRYVFFGSSQFSIFILNELCSAGYVPDLIITTPDSPKGRGMKLTQTVVADWADKKNIKIIKPDKLSPLVETLSDDSFDLFVVASYGKIIPEAILNIPARGTLNVHPSLLPKLRGPSPIETSILTDIKNTGISIMLLDKEMDHGPILAQDKFDVEEWPRREIFEEQIAIAGGKLLAKTISKYLNFEISPVDQDHSKATYTKKIEKHMGEIDINSADQYKTFLTIQAMGSNPGSFFYYRKNDKTVRIKITNAEWRDNKLNILTVIPEGKKEISWPLYK